MRTTRRQRHTWLRMHTGNGTTRDPEDFHHGGDSSGGIAKRRHMICIKNYFNLSNSCGSHVMLPQLSRSCLRTAGLLQYTAGAPTVNGRARRAGSSCSATRSSHRPSRFSFFPFLHHHISQIIHNDGDSSPTHMQVRGCHIALHPASSSACSQADLF